jgi:hypothetical protein
MRNYGVTIYSSNNDRFDLKEILGIVGDQGKQSIWKVSDVECFGKEAEILHEISDNQQTISGDEFYKITSNINQVIDGTFMGYKHNQDNHWILIRSIRGDEFDVETNDKNILKILRRTFKKVRDLIY